jgi:hypothetical protein
MSSPPGFISSTTLGLGSSGVCFHPLQCWLLLIANFSLYNVKCKSFLPHSSHSLSLSACRPTNQTETHTRFSSMEKRRESVGGKWAVLAQESTSTHSFLYSSLSKTVSLKPNQIEALCLVPKIVPSPNPPDGLTPYSNSCLIKVIKRTQNTTFFGYEASIIQSPRLIEHSTLLFTHVCSCTKGIMLCKKKGMILWLYRVNVQQEPTATCIAGRSRSSQKDSY